MVKIAVLASGRGSNLQAIIDAVKNNRINAIVAVVISDVEDSFSLKIAHKYKIKALFVDPKNTKSREEFDEDIAKILKKEDVALVCLAGFMRILSKPFIKQFENRIMNIHPSLLPSFPGLNAQKKALDSGVKLSGCTVHFVNEGVDTGPIIIQAAVPILDGDSEKTLSERILKEEHRIYPLAISAFTEQRLACEGKKVFWENG